MCVCVCTCVSVYVCVCLCVCAVLSDSDLLQPWAESASSAERQERREKPSLQNAHSLHTHTHTHTHTGRRFRALNNTHIHTHTHTHFEEDTWPPACTHIHAHNTHGRCWGARAFLHFLSNIYLCFISGDKAPWYNSKGQTVGQHVNAAMKMKTGLLQNFNCPQKNRCAPPQRRYITTAPFSQPSASLVMQNACKWA